MSAPQTDIVDDLWELLIATDPAVYFGSVTPTPSVGRVRTLTKRAVDELSRLRREMQQLRLDEIRRYGT